MTFRSYEFCVLATVMALIGCAGRPSLLPNSDKSLRKTSTQFAADAAKRQPYKADAPRGGTIQARAQVGYMLDRIEIVNLSDAYWSNIEVWVNKKYVVFVPTMEKGKLEVLPFQMIFDDGGNSFPTDNSKIRVESVELYKDGKMYDVTTKLAD
ncbi:MAG TPA: hypothetical protein VKK61_04405 [Tepidisphaeraceae bacterium]|nr:hypothetical protein [Tepidisphaeraceae bacterium]